VADDLGGGIGMTKPSLVPKPPALPDEPAKVNESKAIPIPQTMEKNKKPEKQAKKVQNYKSNVIPTAPEPGAGGSGGRRGGIGGGSGGGVGISLGPGSGGLGDNYYARAVEFRISDNWNKLPKGMQADMTFSFYIDANGNILGIKQEKSSGNPDMDALALRAIQNSNPLDPPPPEFRKRLIQFVARFVYPPHN
jgi:periplasmic protein TonB